MEVAAVVREALDRGRAVVALESTLIAHGLPWPRNLETALAAEEAVRVAGAFPATIAVLDGILTIGLCMEQLRALASNKDVMKASRRDLGTAIAEKKTAATTVAATMFLAHRAGIRVFATGGIGGVHRGETGDISADLTELARIPVAVICAGAKSILDLRRTLELLETLSVPVIGYGTDEFPAFYLRTSGLSVSARADTPEQAARLIRAHWEDASGGGVVLAQPLPESSALQPQEWERALEAAELEATNQLIAGKALTPFLLRRAAALTQGRSARANQELIVANARLAAQVASLLC